MARPLRLEHPGAIWPIAWMNLTDRAVSHLVRGGEEREHFDRAYADAISAIRRRLASGEGDESPF
jgi:hypothetical protein